MRLDPLDIDWHDGNLVDLQISGLLGQPRELKLILDLYAEDGADGTRRRYCCIGSDLKRILFHSDVDRLVKHRKSGNVDFMRLESANDAEILVVSLFGGVLEAEASTFHLTETGQ